MTRLGVGTSGGPISSVSGPISFWVSARFLLSDRWVKNGCIAEVALVAPILVGLRLGGVVDSLVAELDVERIKESGNNNGPSWVKETTDTRRTSYADISTMSFGDSGGAAASTSSDGALDGVKSAGRISSYAGSSIALFREHCGSVRSASCRLERGRWLWLVGRGGDDAGS